MRLRSLFVWANVVLLGFKSCPASAVGNDISEDNLVFVPFEPFVPCGDGSPAGIYREASPDSASRNNHVMVFLGGGFCASDEDCQTKTEETPFLLSSEALPQYAEGHTLLSRNATENPIASNFTRWIVPYCSQDLWLGDATPAPTEFIRAGDLAFEAALSTWRDSLDESDSIDTLIVAGISAGAIGLMNHVESIQNVSRDAAVGKLRLIIDSAAIGISPEETRESLSAFDQIIDNTKHPLCSSIYTQIHQSVELWNLPCCASVHCMMANDPALRTLTQGSDVNGTERLLLLDSIYDAFAILSLVQGSELSLVPSHSAIDVFTSTILETGGAREQQFVQSVYGSVSRFGENVLWAVSNTVGHGYLLPSLDIERLRCNADVDDSDDIEARTEMVCREDGIGIRGKLIYDLEATAWFTTDSWNLFTVDGESVRNIIFDFIHSDQDKMKYGLLRDACAGPNCIPAGATEPNPAQDQLVLEDEFVSISQGFKILLSVVAACLILVYTLRLIPVKLKELKHETERDSEAERDSETQGSTESSPGTICIKGLTVKAERTDKEILKNLSFHIPPGTMTGLMGSSGAGKSTLMNLLCGQLPPGLIGFQRSGDFEKLGIRSTYLRQFGNSSFQNITLCAYLRTTAFLYGASESELESVSKFLRRSFANRVGEGPHFGGIKIKQLSGGQQRMVAIIATLLTRPKLLLLDEPLSGLDSVSSLRVMEFLRDLVNEKTCSVIISIHQPSDIILEQMDQMMVLHGGTLVVNDSISSLSQGGKRSPAEYIHQTLDNFSKEEKKQGPKTSPFSLKSMKASFSKSIASLPHSKSQKARVSLAGEISLIGSEQQFSLEDLSERKIRSSLGNLSVGESRVRFSLGNLSVGENKSRVSLGHQTECALDLMPMENSPRRGSALWQIKPLMRRMHLEYGLNILKFFELPLCYIFFCTLLRFDQGSPFQFIFTSALFTSSPVFIYTPLLVQACQIFKAHEVELQDNRIDSTAFFIASFCFFVSMPLFSLVLAIAIGYGILGWDFGTYLDQYLLAGLYYIVSYQFARALIAINSGVYTKVDHTYILYTAFSIVMSGVLVSPNKLPPYIRWLTYCSIAFWSISGVALVHFDQATMFQAGEVCSSLQSCLIQNGTFLARLIGFTPLASTLLSYVVLVSAFVVLFAVEFVTMYYKYGTKRKF